MAESKRPLIERLFTEHGARLRAYFRRHAYRESEPSELVQEVYLRMLQVPDLEAIQDLTAYLFTVARNLIREHAIRERRGQGSVAVDDPSVQEDLSEVPAFDAQIDREKRIERLSEVLPQLPPKCYQAVVMKFWHGRSYEEIAQQLDVSTNMVKKYLSQALVHCRRRMGRLG